MPRDVDMNFYNTAKWGCELEGTGCTRATAARVIANYFGTAYSHLSDNYDRYTVCSPYGVWTVMRDSSVKPYRKEHGVLISAPDTYSVEVVTPPMYGASGIPVFQEIIRLLRKKGFFACETAGCHIHVEVKDLKPEVIINIFNLMYSKQKMLMHALGLSSDSSRYRYCRAIPTALVTSFRRLKRSTNRDVTLEEIAKVYYTVMGNTSNFARESTCRYPDSRYYICNATRCLNPNSQWYLGTIEFRLFNSDNHAGKIKSYIQFCLLLVQYAASISKSSFKETTVEDFESEKYKFRCFLLKLNCIGDEFKTMRKFFLENFGNQSAAWRREDPESQARQGN